ncbi:hypothetical protein GCM10018791_41550 [Streptomyces zaomyceticus]|nr:hypothetical protein GCM10018791_41550 [Streptomyces zaomyceticus]
MCQFTGGTAPRWCRCGEARRGPGRRSCAILHKAIRANAPYRLYAARTPGSHRADVVPDSAHRADVPSDTARRADVVPDSAHRARAAPGPHRLQDAENPRKESFRG